MADPRFVVLKFGGTSVASRQRWETIESEARRRLDEGLLPVLVCSALAGVSSRIEGLLDAAVRGEHEAVVARLREQHVELARELDLECELLDEPLDALARLAVGASLVEEVSPRVKARAMALGELMSTRLGAEFLCKKGLGAEWLDAREMLTSCPEPNAPEARRVLSAVCDDAEDPALAARIRSSGAEVVVTQGFIARDSSGETVLLGRGGSDTSAAYLAARLCAVRCEIWTDVPGIFTANPADVPTARLLRSLDYDEAQEIATCGARVVHPRCIPPCRRRGIPLVIRCTPRPDTEGTTISRIAADGGAGVKAISKKTGVMLLAMDTLGMWQQVGFLADLFAVFKRHGVSVDLVSTSESNVTVSLDAAATALDQTTIEAVVRDLSPLCSARVIGPCAAISVVGRRIRAILHRLAPALKVFEEQRIHLVSQAASDLNLTFVVDEDEAARLTERLHALLFDDTSLGPTWKEVFGETAAARGETPPWWQTRRASLLELGAAESPLFVYDEATLDEAARSLSGLESVDRVLYSVKANANREVLRRFESMGLGFECVSPGELARVLELFPELPLERVLFTPNFAPRREYEEALELGVQLTVDSLHPLTAWPEIFRDREIFVRLDPGRARGHHEHVRTAGPQSKFGIAPSDLDALEAAVSSAGARLVGLHAHAGSGIFVPESWSETAMFLGRAAERFPTVKILDLGGGLGVPEKPGQSPLDLEAFDLSLGKARGVCEGLEVWLEPGRYLVARAGVLLAKVTQVKQKGDVRYVGVDVGMNTLIRPALYGAFHEIVNLSRLEEPATEVAHVVGPICETGDTLGHGRRIAPAREGDVILIATAGAYGRAMSSSYNLREPAAERVLGPE